MPQVILYRSDKELPVGLSALERADFSYILHVLFPDSKAVVEQRMLNSFKKRHLEYPGKPQLLLIVLAVPVDEFAKSYYIDAWKQISLQLECKSLVRIFFSSSSHCGCYFHRCCFSSLISHCCCLLLFLSYTGPDSFCYAR